MILLRYYLQLFGEVAIFTETEVPDCPNLVFRPPTPEQALDKVMKYLEIVTGDRI